MENTTETRYGVARGEKIVPPGLFLDVVSAQAHQTAVSAQMESIGLDADVRLVEVEVKTTYSRPRAYKEPVTEDPDTAAEDAPTE